MRKYVALVSATLVGLGEVEGQPPKADASGNPADKRYDCKPPVQAKVAAVPDQHRCSDHEKWDSAARDPGYALSLRDRARRSFCPLIAHRFTPFRCTLAQPPRSPTRA